MGREPTDAEIVATFGPSEEGTIRALAPDRYEEGVAAYLAHYEALHDGWSAPFDGVRELLARLREAGVRVGMVTGKGRRTAEVTLRRFGLEFGDLEAGSPEGPRKASGIRELVSRWGVAPKDALYVGDVASDVVAAREAGVDVVGAGWAPGTDVLSLADAEPDALFRSVHEFARWLFPEESVAARLVGLAQRVQSLAQTGLTFTQDRYDIERYEELREIAAALMALGSPGTTTPFLTAFKEQLGYATPKVDVRAVVLREGRILLAREAADGLWSLPGGWADVGDRPSVAVEREVVEETGLVVRATRLLAVWDLNLHGHPPGPFQAYKLFFLCEEKGGALATSVDTLELGFFAPDALPPLSLSRVVPEEILACVEAAAHPSAPALFD